MKKKIAIVLVVILCLAAVIFIASRDSEDEKIPDTTVSVSDVKEETKEDKTEKNEKEPETEKTTEREPYSADEIEKKDPNEIVEFEIPLVFVDQKYQKNLNKYAKENGYESATLSWDKKKVKIRLKALSYDIYLTQTGISTIRAICETFESKDYPYVVNLGEYEDDFSYVTLLVNKKKFKKADNVDSLFTHVSNCCAYYLLQDNDSPNEYKIDICDEKTGKLLASKSYNKKDFLR